MRLKRVMLINPPTGLYIRGEDRCQVPVEDLTATTARMPLDLAYIAADLLRAGAEVIIKDYPVDPGDPVQDALDFAPDAILASTTSFTLEQDVRYLAMMKKALGSGVLVGLKGAEATISDIRLLEMHPELDFVLKGEYELTMGKMALAEDLSKVPGLSIRLGSKLHISPYVPVIEDLDSLPFPARHLLKNYLYTRPDTGQAQTTIQTGRGCPHSCIYCLAPVLSGTRLRLRTPGSVVDEMQHCVEHLGIKNFFARADTFTMNKAWVMRLSQLILDRGLDVRFAFNSRVDTFDPQRAEALRRAGGWLVAFGVESGSERSLRLMRKGHTKDQARKAVALAKQLGFATYLFFVVGFPWEDMSDLDQTLEFALELDGDYVEIHIAVPFPGTQLEELVRSKGLMVEDMSHGGHGLPVARTEHLSRQELIQWRDKAIKRYYTRPGYVLRMIGRAKSPRVVLNYIKFGINRVLGK